MREIAESFVAIEYPEEADYFPTVWQDWVEHLRRFMIKPRTESQIRRPYIGLTFAKQLKLNIKTPFILELLWAIWLEINEQGVELPKETQFLEAFRKCAEIFEVSTELRERLLTSVAPRVFEAMTASGETKEAPSTFNVLDSFQPDVGMVIVQGLYNGRRFGPRVRSEEEGTEESTKRPYDLVVDEPNWQVYNHSNEKLFSLRSRVKGRNFLIWIAMTRVGENLKYGELSDHPHKPLDFTISEDLDRSLYRLNKTLEGGIRERMIDSSEGKQILIPRKGWSYYWIRIHPTIEESRLLL